MGQCKLGNKCRCVSEVTLCPNWGEWDRVRIPDFEFAEKREEWMIEHAEFFTVVRFLGVGQYERHEVNSLIDAVDLATDLSEKLNKPYMVYAVVPPHDSFIGSVIPNRPNKWSEKVRRIYDEQAKAANAAKSTG